MKKTNLLPMLLGINLALVGCTKNPVVAEVGSVKISKKEVELRAKAMKVFSPQLNDKSALEQLIRSYTLAEVMKNKGMKGFDESVDQEAKRIDESSKNNPKMAEVKKAFGKDQAAFKKLFVVPMLADRLAYMEGYLKDQEFHKAQKEKADKFLSDCQKNTGSMEEMAKKNGFMYKKGVMDSAKGLVWDADRNVASGNLPGGPFIAQQWKKSALDHTPSGKVANTLLEQGNMWVVLKNGGASSKVKGGTEVMAVVIPRQPFGAWLEKNKSSISVKRFDEQKKDANPQAKKGS
jgi:hypothetical protein